jgi:hypothetical protein
MWSDLALANYDDVHDVSETCGNTSIRWHSEQMQ